jgi:hypothetical protein
MSTSELDYSVRMPGAEVLERNREQVIQLEVWRAGARVAPTAAGSSFSLLKPGGELVVDAAPISVVGDIAQYTIPAATLPDTLDLGLLYQVRWKLVLPDGTTRTFRRACTLARFQMVLPVTDRDILDGEYPSLLDDLGQYSSNLDAWLYAAKRHVLRELAKVGQWPEIISSADDLFEVIRQRCMFLVFKFLASRSPSSMDNPFAESRDFHREMYDKEWDQLAPRFDRDGDGMPDAPGRESAKRAVHIGGAPRRTRARDFRW